MSSDLGSLASIQYKYQAVPHIRFVLLPQRFAPSRIYTRITFHQLVHRSHLHFPHHGYQR